MAAWDSPTKPVVQRWWFWPAVIGLAVVIVGGALAVTLRPDKADEFRDLYDETQVFIAERGDNVPPFFDPDYMSVEFAWNTDRVDDRAEIRTDNVVPRHAEYDPSYEAYTICEWARAWVYRHGDFDTDLAIYVDGQQTLVLHDSAEDCVSADAD